MKSKASKRVDIINSHAEGQVNIFAIFFQILNCQTKEFLLSTVSLSGMSVVPGVWKMRRIVLGFPTHLKLRSLDEVVIVIYMARMPI